MKPLKKLVVTSAYQRDELLEVKTNKSYLRQGDIAILIDPGDNVDVSFNKIHVTDCGMPIQHKSGNLFIEELIAVDFTADLFNSVGNLFINKLIVEIDGTGLDYKSYHMDALGQFFNKNKPLVSNVTINNIEALITGKQIQGMMLSEEYNRYSNFTIGRDIVDIQIDYPYALNANQLDNSYINFGDNGIILKDRKGSKFKTEEVIIKRNSFSQNIVTDSKQIYYA